MTALILIMFLGCVTEPAPPLGAVEQSVEQRRTKDQLGIHEGEQHPPIPANSPAWAHDPGGFVPDFRFYGERSWNDVRMRVAGHLFIGARDLARLHANAGEYAQAAASLAPTAERLGQLRSSDPRTDRGILDQLVDGARAEIALYRALQKGDTLPPRTGLNGLRMQVLGAARAGSMPANQAAELLDQLAPYRTADATLGLSEFKDFDDRHRLRAALWAAHLASADPLGGAEPWGYFSAVEVVRQASILGRVVAKLAGLETPEDALVGTVPKLKTLSPVLWPSTMAQHLWLSGQRAGFTVPDLGRLPTGDSMIDVAALPGPMSIGRLEKMGTDDPEHRAWLTEKSFALNRALDSEPKQVPALIAGMVQRLDSAGHGSRYYNIKAARNSAVRVLARTGHPALARTILAKNLPLHHQDWECPNRAGILALIDARLAAQAGETESARAKYAEANAAAEAFLAQVHTAAQN